MVAIPAIVFALFIVHQGGVIWTLGIFALGVVAMGELYTLMGRVRPPAVAGFLTLAAMLAAALYGEPRHVIMVLAASFPVTFFFATLRPRRAHVSWAIAVVYLGVLWIGLAMVHAVWLRELPHGDGLVIDVLVGDLPRRHGRVLRRPPVRAHAAGAADLAEQDARGAHRRRRGRHPGVLGRRALPGLADRARTRS